MLLLLLHKALPPLVLLLVAPLFISNLVMIIIIPLALLTNINDRRFLTLSHNVTVCWNTLTALMHANKTALGNPHEFRPK